MTAPIHPPDAPAMTVGHAHVADLEACLDLINSVELTDGVPEEHLPTVQDAIAYFTTRNLAHDGPLRAQASVRPAAWLARVREARAALREVWDAAVEGRTVREGAVDTLNDVLAHAPRQTLRSTLAGVAVDHRHEDDVLAEALARVAEPLVAAIADGDTGRFRICANDGCRWVFEDTSRGGRRRWCDMSSCGNRAKVRRFRSKRRGADETGTTESGATESGPAGGS
ncbi:MAG TPA: CGNR zinc finger domain-containing protein [Candidatus Limnocylindrales bacterium]|nr:CGNR zinc finger domain-containing protein [Candidatus Limnocylindrales bacterium]